MEYFFTYIGDLEKNFFFLVTVYQQLFDSKKNYYFSKLWECLCGYLNQNILTNWLDFPWWYMLSAHYPIEKVNITIFLEKASHITCCYGKALQ